jgi:ABC-type uncharacterized transport system permease subunit
MGGYFKVAMRAWRGWILLTIGSIGGLLFIQWAFGFHTDIKVFELLRKYSVPKQPKI